ncbi:hypothetical protein TNCV_3499971 [Trichonephila clavipes]|nr:hypothetical protein TNCV_3499971 [Trichonephila clavipes]
MRSLPRQLTIALDTQWRIVNKGGKTAKVGRRGLAVRACVGHLLVCEETSGEDDWRLMCQWALREEQERELRRKPRAGRFGKRSKEDPGVLNRDADQESWTRIRKNALWTVPRQAVERATSQRGYHTG